jgi:hypothetical protein
MKTGLDCKLYRLSTGTRASWGTADSDGVHEGTAPGNLDEIASARDVTKSWENTEIEGGTSRGSLMKKYRSGTTGVSLEITMPYDNDDADYVALLGSLLGREVIALAVLDGDKATTDTMGLWADFEVMSKSDPEPLEEEVVVTFVLRPSAQSSVDPEIVRVTAS